MAGAWPEPGRSLAGAEKKYKKCPNNPAIAPARLRPSSGQWPEYRQPPDIFWFSPRGTLVSGIQFSLILAGPLYKTSGFKCTPEFDFVNSYIQCSDDDLKMQGICI